MLIRLRGIGPTYLGITPHNQGDDFFATLWLTFILLPVYPFERHKLRVRGREKNRIVVDVIEKTPLEIHEVARTYLVGWILTPLLLLGPPFFTIPSVQRTLGIPDTLETLLILLAAVWIVLISFVLAKRHEARVLGRNGE